MHIEDIRAFLCYRSSNDTPFATLTSAVFTRSSRLMCVRTMYDASERDSRIGSVKLSPIQPQPLIQNDRLIEPSQVNQL